MKIKVNDELMTIFKDIANENNSLAEWFLIESSDMFQSEHFCGGFDADEEVFCFSYYNNEYWFSFTLEDVYKMSNLYDSLLEFEATKSQ